jgi:hypothetical protein
MMAPFQNIAAAVISGIFALPLWWAMDRDPPYIPTNGRVEFDKSTQSITVTWDVETKRYCPPSTKSRVARTIIDMDNKSHPIPITQATYGKQESNPGQIKNSIDMPPGVPPGPAKYHSEPCYPCNPWQDYWNTPICVSLPEIIFEVPEP